MNIYTSETEFLKAEIQRMEKSVECMCGICKLGHQRKPLTDKQILADETLRYYFGQNGGAGPVSKQGRKVVNAIEALHEIKEVKSCGS